jgi:hypothetical protein
MLVEVSESLVVTKIGVEYVIRRQAMRQPMRNSMCMCVEHFEAISDAVAQHSPSLDCFPNTATSAEPHKKVFFVDVLAGFFLPVGKFSPSSSHDTGRAH